MKKQLQCFLLFTGIALLFDCTSLPGTHRELMNTLSNRVKPHIYGYSVEKRPLYAYMTGNLKSDLNVYLIGAVHGSEPATPVVVSGLLQKYDRVSGIEHKLIVIPRYNPDGLAAATRENFNDVDLNRDFLTEDRKGPELIQPETGAFMNLLIKHPPALIISVHQPYEVVNYDGPALELAEAMSEKCGYPVKHYIGYPTPGSMGNYFGTERKIPVITFELPKGDDPDEFDGFYNESEAALLYATVKYPPQLKVQKTAFSGR